jgi:hypothetical protein
MAGDWTVVVVDSNMMTCSTGWSYPPNWPHTSRSPGPTRDAAPAGEPASTERQASEGRSGGPGYVTVILSRTT